MATESLITTPIMQVEIELLDSKLCMTDSPDSMNTAAHFALAVSEEMINIIIYKDVPEGEPQVIPPVWNRRLDERGPKQFRSKYTHHVPKLD